ncbi:hypothetical protein LZ30DRAFT_419768 [Colletotrichum cereale]|nr:hypothetical protein LZ30DRAFT_419768 [Colletotrichum cereale]
MPSSKGKPTDPELREELKEEIKQEPNKSGGGEGQWAAWKVSLPGGKTMFDSSPPHSTSPPPPLLHFGNEEATC